MTADRTDDIIWREPPPEAVIKAKSRGQAYAGKAARLRESPGKSGIIQQYDLQDDANARQLTNAVKSGRLAAFRPAGSFDAITATEGGMVNVYAWYVGEPGADSG